MKITYFECFGVEHVPKEIEKCIGHKKITTNIFRIQANNSTCGYFCIGFIDFMLAGKTLIDYTSLFSPYDFEKNVDIILSYLKMNECNSIKVSNKYLNLCDQKKFRLNETNKIKDYFNSEIQERKIMSKKLSKYIAAFDYFDKNLIVSSATSGGISIISFTSVNGIPARTARASFSLVFFLTTGIIKKLLKTT